MPRVDRQELLELETETIEDGSPYMLVPDEDWIRWQAEDLETEVYDCYLCRDSGMGKHPGLYCSCKYGRDLRDVDGLPHYNVPVYWDDYGY